MYKYTEAIHLLIGEIPELRYIYEKNIYDYEDLPYVFFESEFVKYIMNKIEQGDLNKIKKIFKLIEKFLKKGDNEMQNLIEVAVIESLFYEKEYGKFVDEISPFFGKLTKKSFNDCVR